MDVQLEHTYFDELVGLYTPAPPSGFPAPELLLFNDALARTLGVTAWKEHAAEYFSGNRLIEGAKPIAMAYAGHQFGGFSPQLGDGRAVLLGELVDPRGARWDVQLKGSGRTAYSRGGDGRAGVGPVLREYVVSEAMASLGIPSTRVLGAVRTGETIHRDGPLSGAVLCRIAASHLRVGSLEYLAARRENAHLLHLVEYALRRHYPSRARGQEPTLELLEAVAESQAQLIAMWMLVGFVHGVMNTDNMTLSGETIDYGPCAFMDRYDPRTVFSSIDRGGRYAYGNQPLIGKWNLARMGEALLPLLVEGDGQVELEKAIERVQMVLDHYQKSYERHFYDGMRAKWGLLGSKENDEALIADLLSSLEESGADFTSAFRELADDLRTFGAPQWGPMGEEVAERYMARLGDEDKRRVADRMDQINPMYIARNHQVERALAAALAGDLSVTQDLIAVLSHPFTPQPGKEHYAEPPPADFGPYRTFCGT